MPRQRGREGSRGARRGPDTPYAGSTRPLRSPAPLPASEPSAWAAPSLTHHGEAGVSGARGSRFLRRRQQLQQLELRRASAPPHSLPAARAAAARPNGPSTAAARAPRLARPRPAQPALRRTAAPADPSAPHAASTGPWISRARPTQSWALPPAARARAHPPRDYFPSPRAPPPAPRPLHLPPGRRGTSRRRVTRPCVSRAAIGPGPWRK